MANFLDELTKTLKKAAEAQKAQANNTPAKNVWSESLAPKSIGGSSKSSGSGSSSSGSSSSGGGTSTKKQNNSFYEDYQARKQQQSRARFTPSTLLGAQTKKQNSSFYDDYQARKKQQQSGRFTPSLLSTGSSARRFTPSVRRQPTAQDWSESLSPVRMRDMLSAETSAATQRRRAAVKQDILSNGKYRFTDLEIDSVINSQNPREDMTALVKRKGGSDTEAQRYGEYVYYHLLDDTHKKQYNKDMDATERQGLGAQYTTDIETQKARTDALNHMQNNKLADPNSFSSKATEKLRKGLEWGGKFKSWLGNSVMSGMGQFNNGIMNALDFIIPTDFLGENDPLKKAKGYYKGLEQGYTNAAHTRADELGGEGWHTATDLTATVTAAIPQAVTAFMTGGTSTAGSLAPAGGAFAGSAAAAAANGVPTWGYSAANIAQNAMKTPSFWLSFLTEAGNQYEGAKSKGASETQAVLSGLVTGYLNGLVEVGGGIEAIPGAERGLKTFVKSSLEEGLEENTQGMIGNLVDKAVWDKDKQMFSLDDEDAVVNPKRMGEEFAGGALAGGILSGVPMAVGYAADTSRLGQMYRDAGAVQDVIDEGKAQGTGTKAYRQAQNMNADTASNFRVGRQANLNAEAMTDEARLAQLINERTGYDVNYRFDMPSWNAGEIRGNDININANKGQRVDTVLHEVGHIDTPEAQAAADKTIEVLQKPEYKAQLDARVNALKQLYEREGKPYTEQMLLNDIAVDMRRGGLLYRTSADYDRATRTDNYDRDRFIPNTVRRAASTVRSVFGGTVTNENAGITVSAKDANTIREAWERADNASAGAHRNTNPSVSYADSSPNRGASGETAYSVETIPGTNLKYVQADRQVIKSDNPDDWEGEFYDYINNEIRNGRDVIIPTDDGDNLTISEKTAWKLGYRNEIKNSDGSSRYMTDSEYKTKLTAAGHIDELAQISKRGKKNKPDRKNHNFAKDGFNYRTGYFRDFDGRYYRLTISVGLDSENKTVYNIGKIDEVPFPAFSGSKASGKTTSAKGNSVDTSITNSDENVKTKFSVDTNVEETKDLIAVHNLSEDELNESLNLGGFPMPSIAVTKAQMGHNDFGDISVVFGKDTIDPRANTDNRVYSGDAWTPTFPTVEYEASEDATSRLRDKYYELNRKFGNELSRPLYGYGNYLEDELNRMGGEQGVIEREKNNTDMMRLFLLDSGKENPDVVTTQKTSRMSEQEIEQSEFLIDRLGADTIRDMSPRSGENPLRAKARWWNEHGSETDAAYMDYLLSIGVEQNAAEDMVSSATKGEKTRMVVMARNYLNNGSERVTTETDAEATKQAVIDAVDKTEYEAWLKNLFAGAEKGRGIYNGTDFYTSLGNRRSFSATHDEYNLDNIVKNMRNAIEKGGAGGFAGASTFRGVTTQNFSDIDEIRAARDKITEVSENEAEEIRETFNNRLIDLASRAVEGRNSANNYLYADNFVEAVMDALNSSTTREGFENKLRSYSDIYNIDDTLIADTEQLIKDMRSAPVKYFEAKPRRAVGFDEVKAVIVPENASENLKNRLSEAGINTIEYKSGDKADRIRALNGIDDVKFSVDTNAESEDAPPVPNEEDWNNLISEAERGIPPVPSDEDWNNLTEGGNAREQAERRTQIFMEQQGVTSPRELAPDTVTRRQSKKERSLWKSPSPVRKVMGKAYTAVVDDMHPFWNYNKAYERASKTTTYGKDNPYKLSINAKDASSRAAYIVTDEMVDYDNNSIGKGLVDTITDSGITKDTYDEFNKYLVARHALEWLDPDGHGAVKNVYDDPRLNDMGVVQMMTGDFENAHPEFKQAADNLYEWQRKLMKTWLVDTGVITQEQYDTFTQMYPDYVPFFREQDTTLGRGKVGMANQGEVIKEAVGSESRRILEPIENIMYNVASYVNHGTKHEVIKTAVQQYDMLDSDPENNVLRQYWEEVVPVNPEQEQNLYFRPKRGDDPSVDDATNEGERSISSTLRQQSDVRNGVVSFLDDGKMRYFRVYDKDFLNVLDNVRKGRDGVLAMFAAFSRTRAALITSFNPAFSLASNPVRDFGTLITNSTDANKAKIAVGAVSSYYDIAKKSDAYKNYLAMGGQYSSVNTEGMTAMQQALQKLQGKDPNLAKRFFKLFPKGFGVYQTVSDAIEAAPRMAEFKSTLKNGYDYHEAFYRAKDVTTNFSRGGQIAKELNAASNFFNASIQGVDKFFRQAKNNPKSFAIGIACLTVPALLAWAWNHVGDDKDKKEGYDNLSNYHKNNSYNFYIGNGKFVSIPKARESAVITSSIEMALDKFLAKESDRDKDFFADYMLSQFLPDGSIIGLSTINDLRANEDYMGKPIISDELLSKPDEQQFDDSTSYLARGISGGISRISGWLGHAINVSPKKIDYIINSETGVLGKINRTYFTPSSKDDKAAMYSFGVFGTYVKDSLFSTDNLNMFYDNKEKADKQANGYPSADTTYLSNKYTQASGVLSVLNKMYKENSQSDEGREIRKQYVRFARNNKDNPTGLSDEVYNEIKGLYDTDSGVLSLPKVDRTIKYDGASYTFDDAQSVVNYRNDLNEAVDRAYRNLIKEAGYAVATDDEKIGTLLSAKDKAVKEVKQFYIENKGEKRMSFGKENDGKVEKPTQAEITTAATQRAEQQERQAQFQEKASRVDPIIQSVADGVAKASPDDASKYTADSLKIHRVNKMTVDGKEYEISDDIEQKIIADANDEYYTNLEKLQNNEVNVEDIIGYTDKGKAHTSKQADGTKVALTGKLYNEDGTPRFDGLVHARITRQLKELAVDNAKAKYQDEITGAATATETPTETTGEPVQVSRANPSVGYADSSFSTAYEQSSMPTTLKRGSSNSGASRGGGGSSGGSRSGGSSSGTSRVKFTPSGGSSGGGTATRLKFTPSSTSGGTAQLTPTASVASVQRFIPSTRETARQMRFIPRTENAVKPKEVKAIQPMQMI